MAAAMTAGRNSVGVELDPTLLPAIHDSVMEIVSLANRRIEQRLAAHLSFVQDRIEKNKPIKYTNQHYGFPVVTNQEKALLIDLLQGVEQKSERAWSVAYGRMARIGGEAGKR